MKYNIYNINMSIIFDLNKAKELKFNPTIENILTLMYPTTQWIIRNGEIIEWINNENINPPSNEYIEELKNILNQHRLLFLIREERNKLLIQTDMYGLSDYNPLNKQEWLNYRQSLRDLPTNLNLEVITEDNYLSYFPQKPTN